MLVESDADTGEALHLEPLAGVPEVVVSNAAFRRLYVAGGDHRATVYRDEASRHHS